MSERTTWRCDSLNTYDPTLLLDRHQTDEDPNLVSSLCEDGKHRPVLDLDVPHRLVPSTTPGHSHLYIDVKMDWETYAKLLVALAEAGVIEKGFADLSIARGASFVRLPHVKKEPTEELLPEGTALL